jgi:hypothetical protein
MKARTFAFLAALALVAGPMAMAQAPTTNPAAPSAAVSAAPDSTAPSVEGTMVSTGNTSLVIAADDGSTRAFVVGTSTVLPTTELTAGSRVVVRFKPLDADRAEAISVTAIPAAPPAASSTSAGSAVPVPASEAPAVAPRLVSPLAMGIGALVIFAAVVMLVSRRRSNDEVFHLG